jgi:hypothetical protein
MRPVPYFLFLSFQLCDQCGEMRRDGSREGVVLVLQRSPNCSKPNISIENGIDLAFRGTGNDMLTYPIVDPVGCGSEVAHGAAPVSPPPFFALTN